jgi:hypothetical protein
MIFAIINKMIKAADRRERQKGGKAPERGLMNRWRKYHEKWF